MLNFLYSCDEFVTNNDDIVRIIRFVYNAVKIGVPIILIIVGMFDMGKAITQQKEDEIKKAQSLLVKKAVAALIVFLMFALVQLIVNIVGGTGAQTTIGCIDKILNGKSEPVSSDGVQQKKCEKEKPSDGKNYECDTTTGEWKVKLVKKKPNKRGTQEQLIED